MHVVFDVNSVKINDFIQSGSGINYYEGLSPWQRGRGYSRQQENGVGTMLKGLWRMLLPAIKQAGTTLGKEGLASGGRILSNLSEGGGLKDTLSNEASLGVEKLLKHINPSKQQGSGGVRKRSVGKKHVQKTRIILTPNDAVGRSVRQSAVNNKVKRRKSDAFGLY